MFKRIFLLSFLFLSSCTNSNANLVINYVPLDQNDQKNMCEESGGSWEMLRDGCGDKCYRYEKENVMCTMAFKAGCNCGENKCLDSETNQCRDITRIDSEE